MERNEGASRDKSVRRAPARASKEVSCGRCDVTSAYAALHLPSRKRPASPGTSSVAGTGARGIALVWTALLLFVVVGILGLSLDWGKAGWNVHELDNAADAGALAGALIVKTDEVRARQMAILTAFQNHTEGRPVTGEPTAGDVQVNATSEGLPWAALRRTGSSAEIEITSRGDVSLGIACDGRNFVESYASILVE